MTTLKATVETPGRHYFTVLVYATGKPCRCTDQGEGDAEHPINKDVAVPDVCCSRLEWKKNSPAILDGRNLDFTAFSCIFLCCNSIVVGFQENFLGVNQVEVKQACRSEEIKLK